MKFILPFTHQPGSFKISIGNRFLSLGSCFSTHLSSYLQKHKFRVLDNPLGIIYNPISIINGLQNALSETIEEKLILHRDGFYYYYKAHSSINATSQNELINKLKAINLSIKTELQSANFLVITWGTAYSFIHNEFKETVANCHKMPSALFSQQLIPFEEIFSAMENLLASLHSINPHLKIILTVSPVRHSKLGLSKNTIGKAELIKTSLALDAKYENIHYFESYELVTDVLRDYRFYESDMIHPNQQAIDYVIDQFRQVLFYSDAIDFSQEWSSLTSGINHRPFNPNSPKHQLFLLNLKKRLKSLSGKVNIQDELAKVNEMIKG